MIGDFIKKDIVLSISGILAIISTILIRPEMMALKECIDCRTLILLFCLMTVTAGLTGTGVFSKLAKLLTYSSKKNGREQLRLGIILIVLCYFVSMLVTNDAALITFVPLTILVFQKKNQPLACVDKVIYPIVVLETIAANLGSMVTPFGNPQNLFLYTFYEMTPGSFFRTVIPWGAAGLAFVLLLCPIMLSRGRSSDALEKPEEEKLKIKELVRYNGELPAESGSAEAKTELIMNNEITGIKPVVLYLKNAMYSVLFIISIAAVLRFLSYMIAGIIVAVTVFIFDRKVLSKVDYGLLFTFVFFFVFAGNLAGVDTVHDMIAEQIAGRTMLVSALASQIISNVPAAIMLSGFTGDGMGLLLGTDIGGLGTPVASMASLISLRYYMRMQGCDGKKYIVTFMIINVTLFVLMITACVMIQKD